MRIILLGLGLLALTASVFAEFENLKRAIEAKKNPHLTDKDDHRAIYHDYVLQRVDNFNWQNPATFYQRFWFDIDYYGDEGPLFFFITSELYDFEPGYIQSTHVAWVAQQLEGTVFAVEPRYFGESRPTEDLSISNLQFLTIDQTLADIANLIDSLQTALATPSLTRRRVILYGYDLGASYAVWLRKKYPHLVDGVIAYSPTLEAVVDNHQFFGGLIETVDNLDPGCSQIIGGAFDEIGYAIATANTTYVEESLRLYYAIDVNKTEDIAFLYISISELLADTVLSTDDIGIHNFCYALYEYLFDGETYVQALGDFFWYNLQTGPIVVNYNESVTAWRETDYLPTPGRQLLYRYCTEASFFHTSGGFSEDAAGLFPVDIYLQACNDVISDFITIDTLNEGNRRTNVANGGSLPSVSNVHIIYGGNDPDRFLGPSEDINPTAFVDIVEGQGKYFNLLPPHIDDPEGIRYVKERTQALILQWITE